MRSKEYLVEKSIPTAQAAGSGAEIVFDVQYEPIELGKQEAVLTVSNLLLQINFKSEVI